MEGVKISDRSTIHYRSKYGIKRDGTSIIYINKDKYTKFLAALNNYNKEISPVIDLLKKFRRMTNYPLRENNDGDEFKTADTKAVYASQNFDNYSLKDKKNNYTSDKNGDEGFNCVFSIGDETLRDKISNNNSSSSNNDYQLKELSQVYDRKTFNVSKIDKNYKSESISVGGQYQVNNNNNDNSSSDNQLKELSTIPDKKIFNIKSIDQKYKSKSISVDKQYGKFLIKQETYVTQTVEEKRKSISKTEISHKSILNDSKRRSIESSSAQKQRLLEHDSNSDLNSRCNISFDSTAEIVDTPEKKYRNQLLSATDIDKEKRMRLEYLEKENSDKNNKKWICCKPRKTSSNKTSKEVRNNQSDVISIKSPKTNTDENQYTKDNRVDKTIMDDDKCNCKLKHRNLKTIGCKFEFTYAVPSRVFFKNKKNNKSQDRRRKSKEKFSESMKDDKKDNLSIDSNVGNQNGGKRESFDTNYVECFYDKNKKSNKANSNEFIKTTINDFNKSKFNNKKTNKHGLMNSHVTFAFDADNEIKGLNLCCNDEPINLLKKDVSLNRKENFDIFSCKANLEQIITDNNKKLNIIDEINGSRTSINESPIVYTAETNVSSHSCTSSYITTVNNAMTSTSKSRDTIGDTDSFMHHSMNNEFEDDEISQDNFDNIMDDLLEKGDETSDNNELKTESIKFEKQISCPIGACGNFNTAHISLFVRVNCIHEKMIQLEKRMNNVLLEHDIDCNDIEVDNFFKHNSDKGNILITKNIDNTEKSLGYNHDNNNVDDDNKTIASWNLKEYRTSQIDSNHTILDRVDTKTENLDTNMEKADDNNNNYIPNNNNNNDNNYIPSNKYILTRSKSNPNVLCIKPPQIDKYRSCKCCSSCKRKVHGNCVCIRIRVNNTINNQCMNTNIKSCSCINNYEQLTANTNKNESYFSKFVNYFMNYFFFYGCESENLNRFNDNCFC